MPKKKDKSYISDKNKTKGLFDHLKELTEGNDPLYWENLSGGEKVEFQTYMINRFLSMNPDWLEMVDDLQRFIIVTNDERRSVRDRLAISAEEGERVAGGGNMPKDKVFMLYHEILPKGKVFLRYVKGKGRPTIPDALATMLMRYFESSENEMHDNFAVLMRSAEGKQFLVELMQAYGTDEKEVKKIRREIDI